MEKRVKANKMCENDEKRLAELTKIFALTTLTRKCRHEHGANPNPRYLFYDTFRHSIQSIMRNATNVSVLLRGLINFNNVRVFTPSDCIEKCQTNKPERKKTN